MKIGRILKWEPRLRALCEGELIECAEDVRSSRAVRLQERLGLVLVFPAAFLLIAGLGGLWQAWGGLDVSWRAWWASGLVALLALLVAMRRYFGREAVVARALGRRIDAALCVRCGEATERPRSQDERRVCAACSTPVLARPKRVSEVADPKPETEPIGEPPPRSGEIMLREGRVRHWVERRVPELRALELQEVKRAVKEAKREAKSGLFAAVVTAVSLSVLLLLVYAFAAIYILATFFYSTGSHTPMNVAYFAGIIGMPAIAVFASRGIYQRAIAASVIGRLCGGRCVVCGYDIGASGTRDRCPECGASKIELKPSRLHQAHDGEGSGIKPQLRIDQQTGELVRERRDAEGRVLP